MKLSELLAQFKKIEPREEYSMHARRDILSAPQIKPMGGIRIFLRIIETGVGLVLAGFFMLIITGSFLSPKTISPVQYSVIDPAGLHAEANAIDMQIQLAEVSYPQSSSSAESTVATATALGAAGISTPAMAPAIVNATSSQASTTSSNASSSASSSYSIDQALQALSK